jgi:hypothetical protein
MKQSESFSNLSCTDQIQLAERELSAFIAAVSELFGAEEARASAEDWLDESELMDFSPRSTHRDWRTITIAASVRLANRLNVALYRQTSFGTSKSGTEVLPIPSSNCSDYTDDHTIFEEVHENRSAERRF